MRSIHDLIEQVYEMKKKALDIALEAGQSGLMSHIGSSFSSMEIFAALYEVAKIQDCHDPNRDRIIVSKAHCILSYYTALWKNGWINDDDMKTVDKDNTQLHGHPHRCLDRAIEFSGGSLGLGISYAGGVAYACKRNGLSNRVYVVVGDGELNEGIVWESIMSIAQFGLNNITIVVDRNHLQFDGNTDEIMNLSPIETRFKTFGYDVLSCNGHELEELIKFLPVSSDKPRVLIADTIKAHGISFLENDPKSHFYLVKQNDYDIALKEINEAYGKE
jgi:transketolase